MSLAAPLASVSHTISQKRGHSQVESSSTWPDDEEGDGAVTLSAGLDIGNGFADTMVNACCRV